MYSFYSLDYLNNFDYFVKCNLTNTSYFCTIYSKENILNSNNHFFLPKFDYNFLNILSFIFFTIFSFGGLLIFIGKNHYNSNKKFITYYNKNVENLDYDMFLFEYFEEFNNLTMRDLSQNDLKHLKYNFIKVNTRFGEIILNYDYKNEGFNYYCKQSNTYSFEYLETLSRIYVVNYDCKKIYCYEDEDEDEDYCQEKEEKQEKEDKKSVFFNRKKKNNSLDITCINSKNKEIISNKYKYKGNIEKFAKICKFHDYNIIQNDLNYEIVTENGFYDYKIIFFKLQKNNLDLLKSSSNTNIKKDLLENFETQSNISDFSDISSFEDLVVDDEKTNKTFLSFKNFKKNL